MTPEHIFLMRGLGTGGRRIVGAAVGVRAGAPQNFITAPLDCMKTPFLNIKLHLIVDRIGFL